MKRNIFAVCDLEVDYALNFMDYMNRKKNIPFEIQAFTSVENIPCLFTIGTSSSCEKTWLAYRIPIWFIIMLDNNKNGGRIWNKMRFASFVNG